MQQPFCLQSETPFEMAIGTFYNQEKNLNYAPKVCKKFIKEGRNGIIALKSTVIFDIPSKYEQLQSDVEEQRCLSYIRNQY